MVIGAARTIDQSPNFQVMQSRNFELVRCQALLGSSVTLCLCHRRSPMSTAADLLRPAVPKVGSLMGMGTARKDPAPNRSYIVETSSSHQYRRFPFRLPGALSFSSSGGSVSCAWDRVAVALRSRPRARQVMKFLGAINCSHRCFNKNEGLAA